MSKQAPHKFIRVEGQLYRLAGKEVSKDDVKESINKAADKAAIENIATNLVAHCGDIQSLAEHLVENVDDKASVKDDMAMLRKHVDVVAKFLDELGPTYNRYSSKHQSKK